MSKIKNIFFLSMIGLFFFCNYSIKAETIYGDVNINTAGSSLGSNSPCTQWSGYVACYYPRFQFRVTLVDQFGKRVNGTTSVDVGASSDSNTTYYSYKQSNANPLPYTNISAAGTKLLYAYGSGTASGDDYTPLSEAQYVIIPMVSNLSNYKQNNGRDNPQEYSNFFKEFNQNIRDKKRMINVKSVTGNIQINGVQSVDFTSAMLYYTGYANAILPSTEKNSYANNIFLDNNYSLKKDIVDNNYYLLIEPTYNVYYNMSWNGVPGYWYGTAHEITGWMVSTLTEPINHSNYINSGLLSGLSANFIYQAGCNLHITQEEATNAGFRGITIDPNCNDLANLDINPGTRESRIPKMRNVTDPNNGYGKFIVQLTTIIKGDTPTNQDIDLIYEVTICDNDEVKIQLNTNNLTSEQKLNNDFIKNEVFRISGTDDAAVYCYDDIRYDFKDTINKLSSSFDVRSSTISFDIPASKIIVERNCYLPPSANRVSSGAYDDEFLVRYTQNKFKINYLNQQYIMNKLVNSKQEILTTRNKSLGGLYQKGWEQYRFEFSYTPNSSRINIYPNKADEYSSSNNYVDFSSYSLTSLFDYKVNGIISKIKDGNTYSFTVNNSGNNTTYNYKLEIKGSSDSKCKFDNKVITQKNNNNGLQFRIIDLDNPFPARDGTSRLPGSNWLNTKNYVYQYITNNREVQMFNHEAETKSPKTMYIDRNPIYVITLDPTTMMKIREYNKKNDYSEINNNLVCDENNRQCVSNFLRNTSIIKASNFSGECSNKESFKEFTYVNVTTQLIERYRNHIYGDAGYNQNYDANGNNKMDEEDLELVYNYKKNTKFYTCANKTYKSGG